MKSSNENQSFYIPKVMLLKKKQFIKIGQVQGIKKSIILKQYVLEEKADVGG